jgi:carboxylate-amine ligase
MSGIQPAEFRSWQDFRDYFDRLAGFGIVNSIKDFYWDVRPKPEYGTIELRVLDTPLKPVYAAALACYARELCLEWAAQPGAWPSNGSRELYTWNRFNAARDGVDAGWIDPESGISRPVAEVIRADLERLGRRSRDPGFEKARAVLEELMRNGGQAGELRRHLAAGGGMNDLARFASEIFEER